MYETNYSLLVSAVQRDSQSVKKYEYYLNEKVDLVNALAFGNNCKRISDELRLFHFVRDTSRPKDVLGLPKLKPYQKLSGSKPNLK